MLIRPATPADVPAMMALAKHAVTAARWSQPQYEQVFTNPQARRLMLVLEEHSAVLAFLLARVADQEWEIENIAVAGPARRRGLGSRLLGEFLDVIRREGAQAVLLEVRESNQAARLLYEKWAFEECGRRRGYYASPAEDAILYRLFLPGIAPKRVLSQK